MKGVYETKRRLVIDQIDDFYEIYEVDPEDNQYLNQFDEVCEKPSDVLAKLKKYFLDKMLKGEL